MDKRRYACGSIPVVLWGTGTGRLFIAVHGDQSHKEDDVIAILAEQAVSRGDRILSFDLPEHGDRKESRAACTAKNCVDDLHTILHHALELTSLPCLFACSLGAYFSLAAYADKPLGRCLFLSPVVDMERIIVNMMRWFEVSEERLREEGEISTPIGKTLSWEYYSFVKAHPIEQWPHTTSILRGAKDEVCDASSVTEFCRRFGCDMTVMEEGEHFFHTEEQLAFYRSWLQRQLAIE